VLSLLILSFIKNDFRSGLENVFHLGFSNFILFIFLTCSSFVKRCKFKRADIKREAKWIIVWSFTYLVQYGVYLYFPSTVSLFQLVTVQAAAPMVVGLIWKRGENRPHLSILLLEIFQILLLGGAIFVTYGDQNEIEKYGHGSCVFLVLFVAAFCSQVSARRVSRVDRNLVLMFLALFNTFALIGLYFMAGGHYSILGKVAAQDFLIAAGIFGVQFAYLHGLKNVSARISGFIISASVPISILALNWRANGLGNFLLSMSFSLVYCVTSLVRGLFTDSYDSVSLDFIINASRKFMSAWPPAKICSKPSNPKLR